MKRNNVKLNQFFQKYSFRIELYFDVEIFFWSNFKTSSSTVTKSCLKFEILQILKEPLFPTQNFRHSWLLVLCLEIIKMKINKKVTWKVLRYFGTLENFLKNNENLAKLFSRSEDLGFQPNLSRIECPVWPTFNIVFSIFVRGCSKIYFNSYAVGIRYCLRFRFGRWAAKILFLSMLQKVESWFS